MKRNPEDGPDGCCVAYVIFVIVTTLLVLVCVL